MAKRPLNFITQKDSPNIIIVPTVTFLNPGKKPKNDTAMMDYFKHHYESVNCVENIIEQVPLNTNKNIGWQSSSTVTSINSSANESSEGNIMPNFPDMELTEKKIKSQILSKCETTMFTPEMPYESSNKQGNVPTSKIIAASGIKAIAKSNIIDNVLQSKEITIPGKKPIESTITKVSELQSTVTTVPKSMGISYRTGGSWASNFLNSIGQNYKIPLKLNLLKTKNMPPISTEDKVPNQATSKSEGNHNISTNYVKIKPTNSTKMDEIKHSSRSKNNRKHSNNSGNETTSTSKSIKNKIADKEKKNQASNDNKNKDSKLNKIIKPTPDKNIHTTPGTVHKNKKNSKHNSPSRSKSRESSVHKQKETRYKHKEDEKDLTRKRDKEDDAKKTKVSKSYTINKPFKQMDRNENKSIKINKNKTINEDKTKIKDIKTGSSSNTQKHRKSKDRDKVDEVKKIKTFGDSEKTEVNKGHKMKMISKSNKYEDLKKDKTKNKISKITSPIKIPSSLITNKQIIESSSPSQTKPTPSLKSVVHLKNHIKCIMKDYDLRKKLSRRGLTHYFSQLNNSNPKSSVKERKEHENLIITVDNELKDTNIKSEKTAQNTKTSGKTVKYKKVKLIIKLICDDSDSSSDVDDDVKSRPKDCGNNEDLSFLDDLNIDELVESLKNCHDNLNTSRVEKKVSKNIISEKSTWSENNNDSLQPKKNLISSAINENEIKQENINESNESLEMVHKNISSEIVIVIDDDEDEYHQRTIGENADSKGNIILEIKRCKSKQIKTEIITDHAPNEMFSEKNPVPNVQHTYEKVIKTEANNDKERPVYGVISIDISSDDETPVKSSPNYNNIINIPQNSINTRTENVIRTDQSIPGVISIDLSSVDETLIKSEPNEEIGPALNSSNLTTITQDVINIKPENIQNSTSSRPDIISIDITSDEEITIKSEPNEELNSTTQIENSDISTEIRNIKTESIANEEQNGASVNENNTNQIKLEPIEPIAGIDQQININCEKHITTNCQQSNGLNVASEVLNVKIEPKEVDLTRESDYQNDVQTIGCKEGSKFVNTGAAISNNIQDNNNPNDEEPAKMDTDTGIIKEQENSNKILNVLSVSDKSLSNNDNVLSAKKSNEHLNEIKNVDSELGKGEKLVSKTQESKTSLPTGTTLVYINRNLMKRKLCQENNVESELWKKDEERVSTIQEITTLLPTPTSLDDINLNFKKRKLCNESILMEKLQNRMSDRFSEQFNVVKLIHRGKFSKIYYCLDAKCRRYATKVTYSGIDMDVNVHQYIAKKNHHCIQAYNNFSLDQHQCFLLEYYPMNLKEALQKRKNRMPLYIEDVRNLARQLVSAVKNLRDNNLIHSDIKPAHIMLNFDYKHLKLCGFDSVFVDNTIKVLPNIGTISYRAPEIILAHSASFSIDVWSVALVIYEMATNYKLFPGAINNDVLYKQMCILGSLPQYILSESRFKQNHYIGNFFMKKPIPGNVKQISLMHPNKFSNTGQIRAYLQIAHKKHWTAGKSTLEQNVEIYKYECLDKLLNSMLNMDPYQRIDIEGVMNNIFFYA